MAFEFKLPDIGEGTAEGEIVKWLVAVGDQVQEDQPLVEVMTDKATVEIPSPRTGKILELGADEGEVVEVGEMLVVFGEADDEVAEAPAEEAEPEPVREAESGEAGEAAAEAEVSDEEIEEARSRARAERQAAESAEEEGAEEERRPWEAPPAPEGRVLATPATRRLARELEIDLTDVPGSGADGRVMKEDVLAYAEAGPEPEAAPAEAEPVVEAADSAPEAPAEAPAEEERVPLRGLRRRIAERMVQSKSTIPHFTYVEEVDMTEVVELRRDAKGIAEEKGVKLTYLPFIIKALIPALKEHPYLNSSLDEESEEIVLKRTYNIGIATATDRGLIVPVVKDAEGKSLLELAAEIERLATAAREGDIGLEDLQGGTFTITSTGNIGGVIATPIVNPPEVAILGVTRIRKRPMVVDDEIAIRQMLYLSLSVDHRVVDGAVAAEFMADLVRYLRDPKLLLLETL